MRLGGHCDNAHVCDFCWHNRGGHLDHIIRTDLIVDDELDDVVHFDH